VCRLWALFVLARGQVGRFSSLKSRPDRMAALIFLALTRLYPLLWVWLKFGEEKWVD
jgi:hypothetical protein